MHSKLNIKKLVIVALTASLIGGVAYASDPVGPVGMKQDAMSPAQRDNAMKVMQDKMLKMHEYMNRISAAKTPAERDRLKLKQRQFMQANMQTMMPMMGGMDNMNGKGNGGCTGNKHGMSGTADQDMHNGGKGAMPIQR